MPNTARSPFMDLVQGRKSIRRYLDKPVSRDVIKTCLEAARVAPSADNAQPWRFLVIDDPEIKAKLGKEAFSGIYSVTKFAAKAPVLIVILGRLQLVTHKIGRQVQNIHFHYIDIGVAGEHFVLQAEEMGLGTCWLGWFNVRKVRKLLKIPPKYKIISMLAVGHYEKKPSRKRSRKSLEEIVWFNKLSD